MIHVLHIVWGLEVGGKERFLSQLVRELPPTEFTQSVWALRRKGSIFDRLSDEGYDVEFIGKRPGLDPLSMVNIATKLREASPDVVHVHEFTSAFATRFAARGRPYRMVATLHGGHQGLTSIKRAVYYRLLQQMTAVVPVSRHIETMLRQRLGPVARIRFIPYGIDPAPFREGRERAARSVREELNLPGDAELLVMVARLRYPKNQDLAIGAAEKLFAQSPRAHLLLVGGGRRRVELEKLVKSLYLEDRVHLLGEREDVARLVAGSDVGLLATGQEGLPLAVQEYMAAGIPVVATDAGGVRELVHDGVNGFVVAARPEDMADRAWQLLRDPQLRRRMGEAGRSRLDSDYSTAAMLKRYAMLYKDVVQYRG